MAIDIESITSVIKEGMPALEVLAGSKAVALFIEKVSGAVGWYMEPKQLVRKARAEVAANLIKVEADQEAKAVEQRIATRIINEETKYQHNMEEVVLGALPNIREDSKPEQLDEDWITNFFGQCRQISNEEMLRLWSHVLSGEVNNPGTFSRRTLNWLATFSKDDGDLFKELSSYVWYLGGVKPIIIVTEEMLKRHASIAFRVGTGKMHYSEDIGISKYSGLSQFTLSGEDMLMYYNGKRFSIEKKLDNGLFSSAIDKLPAGYMKLTQAAEELITICTPQPSVEYMSHIMTTWEAAGIRVTEVKDS